MNRGVNFSKLKNNDSEWTKLREVLTTNNKQLESCILKGSQPLFGYPNVLFDSPDKLKKGFLWSNIALAVTTKNNEKSTIRQMLQARDD